MNINQKIGCCQQGNEKSCEITARKFLFQAEQLNKKPILITNSFLKTHNRLPNNYKSKSTIAYESDCHTKTVERAIPEFEAMGWIFVIRRGWWNGKRLTNVYAMAPEFDCPTVRRMLSHIFYALTFFRNQI